MNHSTEGILARRRALAAGLCCGLALLAGCESEPPTTSPTGHTKKDVLGVDNGTIDPATKTPGKGGRTR